MIIWLLVKYLLRKFDKRPYHLSQIVSVDGDHNSIETKHAPKTFVSIVIPTKDRPELLRRCLQSIRKRTKDLEYEIIIVNNGSVEPDTLQLLKKYEFEGVLVVDYPERFNFSAMCNLAAENAKGGYLCFLNNDVEILSSDWLSSMVAHASKINVGIVGAVLKYPTGRLQHMGVALGYTGVAGHPGRDADPKVLVPPNCYQVSAVTFACAVIETKKFWELNGLDEHFPSGFNDVDICIRTMGKGLKNIVCHRAVLTHHESQTRPASRSQKGFYQATKDVSAILLKHKGGPAESFFSR
jgi:GT2 family glycosyltransferase